MQKEKVKILLYNQRCRLLAGLKCIHKLRTLTRIKAKGYFWSPAYRSGQWDGFINYITEKTGMFEMGLLSLIVGHLKEEGYDYKIQDMRKPFSYQHEVNELGGLEFFKHQKEAVESVLHNKFEGFKYQRGIINDATNAGKSLIAAGIFSSYSSKRNGLFLVNGKELYDQAVNDLEKLLPGQIGQLNADKFDWKRINVCMVQTLGRRLKTNPKLRGLMAQQDIILVDEADELMGRKDCKDILKESYNATVRVALTGTALKSKDKNRNMGLIAWFGPIIHQITNKELVDLGISSKPDIRIYTGNTHVDIKRDWEKAYRKGVICNKRRNKRIWRLIDIYANRKNRLPILILFKNHKHADKLKDLCPKELDDKYVIRYVHGKTIGRPGILAKFNEGKIDILFASMIIKRGKNVPLAKVLLNAAGGDSEITVLQIFGRILRKHKTKDKVYMLDLWDKGEYLQRHSLHRVRYYKQQKFEVREIYKKV